MGFITSSFIEHAVYSADALLILKLVLNPGNQLAVLRFLSLHPELCEFFECVLSLMFERKLRDFQFYFTT